MLSPAFKLSVASRQHPFKGEPLNSSSAGVGFAVILVLGRRGDVSSPARRSLQIRPGFGAADNAHSAPAADCLSYDDKK